MYKTLVYTLLNGNIQGLAHQKWQKLQKVLYYIEYYYIIYIYII